MRDFVELIDLASERLGGVVLLANDEFFAPKENLLKSSKPVFIEDKYTDRGKWMDGWESRRRRSPGHDWCIIRLGLPGIIRGVVVDTSHFRGNHPEHCSIEACSVEGHPDGEQLTNPSIRWVELLPESALQEDAHNRFPIENPHRFTHLRFNIFPDGGVARLRVHGEVVPDWKQLNWKESEIDLAAIENGGSVVACSDMFFGSGHNLIMPGPAKSMSDGWETRRRRQPGFDWAMIKLGISGSIRRVEVDTRYFKGNFPESCSLEASNADRIPAEDPTASSISWQELLPRTKLEADTRHFFEREIKQTGPVTHVRLNIFPDGGVSRVRVFGRVSQKGRVKAGLRHLNVLLREDAEAELLNCCGSRNWARRLAQQRPFEDVHRLLETAERIWGELSREDWLEAFTQHPKIGEKQAALSQAAEARRWSEQEQSGTHGASQETLAALAEANRAYEAKFGYIFIIWATGKNIEEVLGALNRRLENTPETELRIVGEEQRRITRLRLGKLLEQ